MGVEKARKGRRKEEGIQGMIVCCVLCSLEVFFGALAIYKDVKFKIKKLLYRY